MSKVIKLKTVKNIIRHIIIFFAEYFRKPIMTIVVRAYDITIVPGEYSTVGCDIEMYKDLIFERNNIST